jgi:hypothetical protein
MMTAAMQNVTNEKAPTMKCMQLFLTNFGERNKDRRKKVKTQANWEEKGHDRSQLDTKCQEFGYGHLSNS